MSGMSGMSCMTCVNAGVRLTDRCISVVAPTYVLRKKLYPRPGGDINHVPTTGGNLDTYI